MSDSKNRKVEGAPSGAEQTATSASVPTRYVTTREAGAFLGLAVITLATWRGKGKGPPYTRVGRNIRYSLADLADFMSGKHADTKGAVKVFPGVGKE